MSLLVPRDARGRYAPYFVKSGSRYFITAEELSDTTRQIINRAFLIAIDKTAIELSSTIPTDTGQLFSAFFQNLKQQARIFTKTGEFVIDLGLLDLDRPYGLYNIDNLNEWSTTILNKFSVHFDTQLRLFGMEGSF